MTEITEITRRQFAAARALAGIGPEDLAKAANITVRALTQIEAGPGISAAASEIAAVRAALESAGVEFLGEAEGGPGVRLRKPKPEPDSLEASELNASNDE